MQINYKKLLERLRKEFENKCAYCHSENGSMIEHFYPKNKYPEKETQLENLLLACPDCTYSKADKFPLNNGEPMLLNPRTDNYAEHILLDSLSAFVKPLTEKGAVTIDVLGLNRDSLVERRKIKIILEIHETVFNHLITNHPNVYFALRSVDKGGYLRNRRWLLGDNEHVVLSFWQGEQNKAIQIHNIFFSIKIDGSTFLGFVNLEENLEKSAFFEKIAKILKMTPIKSRNGVVKRWQRVHAQENSDYLQSLDDFLDNEKPLLDALISLSNIPSLKPIEKPDFEKSLQRVQKFRGQPIHLPIKTASEPLRLKTLKLTNISHFDDLDIDISSNATCFIGGNGSGKTTILRAIAFGLVGFSNEAFVSEGIEKLNNKLKNFLKIKKAKNQQVEYAPYGKIELLYNKTKQNCIEFQLSREGVDENGRLRGANEVEMDDSKSDFDALDDSLSFKNLVMGFSQSKSSIDKVPNGADPQKASVLAIFNLIYNQGDFSFDYVQDWIVQAFNPNHSVNTRLQAITGLKKAFEIMTSITGEKIELGEMDIHKKVTPLIKMPDAPNGIPLDLVSQGYENLIGWVGYLVKRLSEMTPVGEDFTKTPAICLIDEIDTYLHPKWQSRILHVLVTSFPNVQFIVTTHSPYVVGSIPKGLMKLYICKQQVEEFTEFTPYGANIERLTEKIFGTPVRFETVATIVTLLRTAIQNNDFEKADQLLQQLEELGVGDDDNDPEIGSLKILLRTKKRKAGL